MYEIFLIVHLMGVVIGAGSALVTDTLFFGILRDHQIDKSEYGLLKITSQIIWAGVGVLIISGLVILIMSDFAFLANPSFQFKMVLVGIIIINGIIFHKRHLPLLSAISGKGDIGKKIEGDSKALNKFKFMFFSGAVSMVSWLAVIILGGMRSVDLSFIILTSLYLVILFVSFFISQFTLSHMFLKNNSKDKKSHPLKRGAWPYITILAVVGILAVAFFVLISNNTRFSSNRTDTEITLTPKAELEWDNGSHVAYAPNVPPSSLYKNQRIFEVKLEVLENVCPIDQEKNITHETWGYRIEGDTEVFCGAPGPTLRGRVGDVARITLTNLPENAHPHNIDFHSVTGQGGGARDLTVAPGETASIDVRLLYPGAFMYHCAYGDVPVHIARGMYGMFIVDPAEPLPVVDHEWSIMQSEWYTTKPDNKGFTNLDDDALFNEEPSIITFNGSTGALIGENALNMNVGERARIYFVNQGINLTSNFHAIGSHWDIVYPEGATHPANTVIHGSQSTSVVAGGGTVVELVAYVPSSIILVDHALVRAFYKGAKGIINVHGAENPELYEARILPRSAGEELVHEHESDQMHNTQNNIQVTIPVGAALKANAATAFSPKNLTVKAGTTVTWTNTDGVMHTVTSGTSNGSLGIPDNLFDSGFLKKGETFSYTFNNKGTFPYYCSPHPWATGAVVVE